MKKENKKLAQERRAKEKKRKAVKEMAAQICKIGIPVLAFLILVGVILFDPFSKKETATDDTAAGQTAEQTFSTDSSLEVQQGDTVNIDYVGSVDGVEFEGGNTQGAGTDLTIGSSTYIDNFEEQLIGAHPGDSVDVNVTFPKDYHVEDLKGKAALFKVVVNGIYK